MTLPAPRRTTTPYRDAAMSDVTTAVLASIVVVLGAIIVFAAAVWFGWRVLAGRIQVAADRVDPDEEEPG